MDAESILQTWNKNDSRSDKRKLSERERIEEIISQITSHDGPKSKKAKVALDKTDKTKYGKPWSYKDYLMRVHSFSVDSSMWFGKPRNISSYEIARYGYHNSGVDEISCEVCDAKLTHDPSDVDGTWLASQLQSEHDADKCDFGKVACHENYKSLPAKSEEAVLGQVHESVLAFRQFFEGHEDASDERNTSFDLKVGFREDEAGYLAMLAGLMEALPPASTSKNEKKRAACLLALFNWMYLGDGRMMCGLCGRRVQLTAFKDNLCDPAAEHRVFCPFIEEQGVKQFYAACSGTKILAGVEAKDFSGSTDLVTQLDNKDSGSRAGDLYAKCKKFMDGM